MKCKHRYFLNSGLDTLHVITENGRYLVFCYTIVAGAKGEHLNSFIPAFEEMDEDGFMDARHLWPDKWIDLYCKEIDTSVIEPQLTVNGKPPELFKDIL